MILRSIILSTAALMAAPAIAQAPAKPAATAQQQQPATRAAMVRSLDANFKTIDGNGDGTLSSTELAAAESRVQQGRLSNIRTRVEGEFTKLDTNRDGSLSKAEFMAAAPTKPSVAPNGAALVARLDKNKDGKVSADEYRAPMLAGFDKADTNKDGTISTAERTAAQASQASARRN